MASSLPKIKQVLELCLYARSLPKSVEFYSNVLRLTPSLSTPRLAVFPLAQTTLMLFQRGETTTDNALNGGIIPGHGLSSEDDKVKLKTHFALSVEKREDVDLWEKELRAKGVEIMGKVDDWPGGGKSVYFADPDGNVGELASKGIWPHY